MNENTNCLIYDTKIHLIAASWKIMLVTYLIIINQLFIWCKQLNNCRVAKKLWYKTSIQEYIYPLVQF